MRDFTSLRILYFNSVFCILYSTFNTMSFTSKNLHSSARSMNFIKWATLFFLWMSFVLFMTNAFEITPVTRNAVQYIQSIFLTSDGYSTSTGTISLNGSNGNAHFAGNMNVSGIIDVVGTGTIRWNLGIGTTTPTSKLHVFDNTVSTVNVSIEGGSDTTQRINFIDADNETNSTIGGYSSENEFSLRTIAIRPMTFWTHNTEKMRIAADGKVGIGTTTPSVPLQVSWTVMFGNYNSTTGGTSSVLWGSGNIISGGAHNSIVGGISNGINGNYNGILWGGNNSIVGHNYWSIIWWSRNMIDAAGGGWIGALVTPSFETIINGYGNEIHNASYSLIAWGQEAVISGHQWVFLWSDSVSTWFTAQKSNTFLINASSGVGIGTNTPTAMLTVNGGIKPISRNATTNPCDILSWTYPRGTEYYNSLYDKYCYCGSGNVARPIGETWTVCYAWGGLPETGNPAAD